MAITLKVKRGQQSTLPTLAEGELGFTTDEKRLYIGSGDGNVEVAKAVEASASAAGLMSASDKNKLDGVAAGANKYTLPNATASTLGGVKVGANISVSSGTISVADAGTNAKGVVQLSDSISSPSATTAATSGAVKEAYDLALSAADRAVRPPKTVIVANSEGLGADVVASSTDNVMAKVQSFLGISTTSHSSTPSGYRVYLLCGTYTVSGYIDGMVIEGEDAKRVTVKTSGLSTCGTQSCAVKNLKLQASSSSNTGISISGDDAVVIDGVDFGNFSTGLSLYSCSARVTGCRFSSCTTGIKIDNSAGSYPGSLVEGCNFTDCTTGIYASGSSTFGVDTYSGNTFTGGSTAIQITGSDSGRCAVAGNTVKVTNASGVAFDIAASAAVTGNQIKVAAYSHAGAVVKVGFSSTLTGNCLYYYTAASATTVGIQVTGDRVSLCGNILTGASYGTGLAIEGSSCTATGNTVLSFITSATVGGSGNIFSDNQCLCAGGVTCSGRYARLCSNNLYDGEVYRTVTLTGASGQCLAMGNCAVMSDQGSGNTVVNNV